MNMDSRYVSYENDMKYPQENNFGLKKIPLRKNFGPTKYTREKILDPRNTHKK